MEKGEMYPYRSLRIVVNLGYTGRNKTEQKHNTMYVGHYYAHAHTINVNKACALQQTTGKTDFNTVTTNFNGEGGNVSL
jgi:hypothetical protein